MRRGSVAPPGDDTAGSFGGANTSADAPERAGKRYGAATNQFPPIP